MMEIVYEPSSLWRRSCGKTGATPRPPPTSTTLLRLLDVGRQAQRADEVQDGCPFGHRHHLERGLADRLDHDRDRAAPAVEIRDRERNALSRFVDPHHDEVSRLARPRYLRGQYLP